MAKQKAASKPVVPTIDFNGDCEVTLPDRVCKDVKALRRLHHRMVDLIADNGHTAWMISDIELCLGALADDLLRDLIAEASKEGA